MKKAVNLTKKEMVSAIAEKAGVTKVQAQKAVNAFIDEVTGALKTKKKVTLIGFGTFSTKHRNKKKGINPKTGQSIMIPAKDVPHFSASSKLKEVVANK